MTSPSGSAVAPAVSRAHALVSSSTAAVIRAAGSPVARLRARRSVTRTAAMVALVSTLAAGVPAHVAAAQRFAPRPAVESAHARVQPGAPTLPSLSEMVDKGVRSARLAPGAGQEQTPMILASGADEYCSVGRGQRTYLEASAVHEQKRRDARAGIEERNQRIRDARRSAVRTAGVTAAAVVGVFAASKAIGSKRPAAVRTPLKPAKYLAAGVAAYQAYRLLRDAQVDGRPRMGIARIQEVPESLRAQFDRRIVRAPDCNDPGGRPVADAAGPVQPPDAQAVSARVAGPAPAATAERSAAGVRRA